MKASEREEEIQVQVGSESEVAQSCPTLCDPMDCSLPGFSVRGILQARVLEWVAISFCIQVQVQVNSLFKKKKKNSFYKQKQRCAYCNTQGTEECFSSF